MVDEQIKKIADLLGEATALAADHLRSIAQDTKKTTDEFADEQTAINAMYFHAVACLSTMPGASMPHTVFTDMVMELSAALEKVEEIDDSSDTADGETIQ